MIEKTLYDALREFADSWALMAMFLVFAFLCAWPFRPGGKANSDSAANMIFKDDDHGE